MFMTSLARLPHILLILIATATAALAVPATAPALTIGIQSENLVRHEDPAVRAAAFRQMRLIGVKVTRVTLSWRDVGGGCSATDRGTLGNPNLPCYNWGKMDSIVSMAKANRIALLVSITEAPEWANNHHNPFNTGASPARFDALATHYSRFASAAAKRYGTGSAYGFVSYWTIWNEPNSRTFWAPFNNDTPRRYGLLYARSAKAIKLASPRSKVAPGPTGPNSTGLKPADFIRLVAPQIARYGGSAYVDAWAHNPYPAVRQSPRAIGYTSPSIGMGNLRDLFVTLDRQAVTRRKPVWATEFSYQTNPPDPTGVSLATQATYLAEAFDILWTSKRVTIGLWYVLRDPAGEPDWQSGLIRANGRAKPSLPMFKRMVSRSVSKVRRGGAVRIWGMSTTSPGTATLVWSRNGRSWARMPGVRRRGGVVWTTTRFQQTMYVATRDAGGRGPARIVRVG